MTVEAAQPANNTLHWLQSISGYGSFSSEQPEGMHHAAPNSALEQINPCSFGSDTTKTPP